VSTVNVTGISGAASSALKVHVNITHNWSNDLELMIVAPNGAYGILKYPDYSYTNDGNINATYTINASSVLANGTWTLKVIDVDPYYTGDYGVQNNWSLTF
ncbi:MAG TPA: proprotein convertase P-domain-containing protein, partial [Rhodanobacter sp.]|nr:proprotein convertase P-domain-containing protein [Rhodanobacter sp.]